MEAEKTEAIWQQFEQEMKEHLNTSTMSNDILGILNGADRKRVPIVLDSLPKR
jgi:hypothetical protein